MKNNVGRGAFVLIISGFICKIFGGLFRLPLTNIISIQGIGMYQMIMSIYSLALVFVSGGVTNALSKLVSSARARGNYKVIGSYLKYGLLFTSSLSVILSLFLIFFSKSLSSLQGMNSGGGYVVIAFILPLGALVGVARGLMQGYSNMFPTAISQIIEQVTKFIFGLFFAYIFTKNGVFAGVVGALLGILTSEILALLYLSITIFRRNKFEFSKEGKREFFEASLPLSFGGIIIPFSHAVESLTIVGLLAKAGIEKNVALSLYGLQTGVVGSILNFPLIISLSVAISLLPNLSYLSSQGDNEGQKQLISKSFLAMWYILLPLVVGLMSIAGELYRVLFPKLINDFLKISLQLTIFNGISIILTAIMQFLLSILQANGYYSYSLFFSILGGLSKLAFLFIFARMENISIFAISISNILLALVISICILLKLGYLIKLPVFDIVLPILSVSAMFISVKIFLSLVGGMLGLFASIIIGMIIYFSLTYPLTIYYIKLIISKLNIKKWQKN